MARNVSMPIYGNVKIFQFSRETFHISKPGDLHSFPTVASTVLVGGAGGINQASRRKIGLVFCYIFKLNKFVKPLRVGGFSIKILTGVAGVFEGVKGICIKRSERSVYFAPVGSFF